MRRALAAGMLAGLLLAALPVFAAEDKPLTDLQILQVEKWEAELRALVAEQQLRQLLSEQIRDQFNRWVAEQGKGCKLDMKKRRWVECPEPKGAQ